MHDSARPATGYPYPNPYPNPPPQSAAAANGYPPPNTGAAYPYQNPYYAPAQNHPRAVLYRRLFIIFTVFLIVMGLALITFFLVVRPHLPDVNLNSLSVSGFNVSNSQVSGSWDLQFQVRNPNSKMSLYYYDVDCAVYYRRELLTTTRLPPFDQGTKDQTPINATLSASSTYVEGRLTDSIGKERADRGSVEFGVKLSSIVGFRYGMFRRRRYVSVFCDDVAVGLPANSNSGKMIGPAKECKVY